MSYSFSVKGATKDEAIAAARQQLDEVQRMQPSHVLDMPAAKEAVAAFASLVDDFADDYELVLSVNGSVSTYSEAPKNRSVSITVQAYLLRKQPGQSV